MKERICCALLCAMVGAPALAEETARAQIRNAAGEVVGTVSFVEGPKGVLVSADLRQLPSGAHGFHIHETGSCAPDFKAAGGHYNPAGTGHGLLHAGGHHAGDLPNLQVADNGWAAADYFTTDVTLAKGVPNSLFDADGSSIIIHEKPDSYGEDAGAGGRIACGVIETD